MSGSRRRFITLAAGSLAAGGLVGPALARGGDAPPNVFFSPHGRPYRAPDKAPYPVVDWFKSADRNGDGKLDRDEFVADAEAFFAYLDQNGDGALSAGEIAFYERRIAPEVLGMHVVVYADGQVRARPGQARLWLAQYGGAGPVEGAPGPMEGGPWGQNGQGPNGREGPGHGAPSDPGQGGVLPPGAAPGSGGGQDYNAGPGTGAAPYSLFRTPEPVTAADADYVVSAVVRKEQFLAHAQANFAALDPAHRGYLSLDALPQTPVQRMLGRG